MKRLLNFLELFGILAVLLFVFAPLAHAQTQASDFGSDFVNTPLDKLKLNGLTIYTIIRVLGQAYSAIRSGGGLKGIFNALVYGENVPRVIAQDYKGELGLAAVPTTGANGAQITPQVVTPPQPPAPNSK